MGMSASQARLLSLQARQSNLEYQGQQINQERTILSQQATALYNSLLSMTVPTPPSTADYQTVQYTGTLGATEYTFDANSIKPNGDLYSITMQEKAHGDSLQKNTSIALVTKGENVTGFKGVELDPTTMSLTPGEPAPTGNYVKDTTGSQYMVPITLTTNDDGTVSFPVQGGTYFTESGGVFTENTGDPKSGVTYYELRSSASGDAAVQVAAEMGEPPTNENEEANYITRETALSGEIWIAEDGVVRPAKLSDFISDPSQPNFLKFDKTKTYVEKSDNANAQSYKVKGDIDGVTVGGKGVHRLTEEEKQTYGNAINNCGLKDANGEPYTVNDFLMYYDDKGAAVFVLESDVNDGNTNAITYSYVANGEYTKNTTYDDVQLTFDPTNGRITEIAIPTYTDNGEISSWTSISVAAETVTDEAAYEDAYNKYEYDTYLYDQKNKEINAKTEVIQQEDKNLELKLQRLDNERTQITTEIEAVEKVINDNIEASYKTFSG